MFNLSFLFRMSLPLFILYSISKAADQNTVTAAIPADFAPHYQLDKEGNPTGFAVEVFNEVADIAGLHVRYIIKPNFPEAFKALKNAEADVIPNAGITFKREAYSLFSVPMETFVIGAFKRSGSPDIKTLEDIQNRKVVTVKNNIGVKLMQHHPSHLLTISDNQQEALFSLLSGESDIWVYPVPVVQKILINTGLEERVEQFGEPLKEIRRAIQTIKSKPDLAQKLDTALQTFLKTPRFHEIYEKWYGQPSPWLTIERVLWILGGILFFVVIIMAYWRYHSLQRVNRLLGQNIDKLQQTKYTLEEYKDKLEILVTERTQALQREIQDHMAAEAVLRRFKDTLDQTLDCIFMFHPDSLKFFYVNRGATQQVGYTAEEMMEMTPLHIKPAFTEKSFREMIAPLILGEMTSTTFETVHKHKDGTLIPVEVFLQYITQEDEEPRFLAIVRDITERKKAEAELNTLNRDLKQKVEEETAKRLSHEHLLVQQSKMAAMGEMIGAIAHQWRQPLNSIYLQAQEIDDILTYENGDPKQLLAVKEILMKTVKFMNQTIEDFRNFFKPSRDKEIFYACEAAHEVFSLIEAQAKNHGITLEVGEHEHFRVHGYKNEFNQVLLNLFNNARDAILDKKIVHGVISVAIENDGEIGTIRIRDNGGGISETLLPDKLFQPYTTTKGEKGTGIGLYISKTIIESHMGGTISVQNIEEGTEFKITLPLAK